MILHNVEEIWYFDGLLFLHNCCWVHIRVTISSICEHLYCWSPLYYLLALLYIEHSVYSYSRTRVEDASADVSGRPALPEVVRVRVCTAGARALLSARASPLRAEAADGARGARAAASRHQRRRASGGAWTSARRARRWGGRRHARCATRRLKRQLRQRLTERALRQRRQRRRVERRDCGGGPRECRERGDGARAPAAAQEGQPDHLAARRAERPRGPREARVPARVHHLLGTQRPAVARAHLHAAARPRHTPPARLALRRANPSAISPRVSLGSY